MKLLVLRLNANIDATEPEDIESRLDQIGIVANTEELAQTIINDLKEELVDDINDWAINELDYEDDELEENSEEIMNLFFKKVLRMPDCNKFSSTLPDFKDLKPNKLKKVTEFEPDLYDGEFLLNLYYYIIKLEEK